MNGTIASLVTSRPLTAPQNAVAATPPSAATPGDAPDPSSNAMTTVERAIIDPTERSIPPAAMIIVMPRAAVLTIAV